MTRPHHHWVTGGSRLDREQLSGQLALPPALVPAVDAHRRLRGPYTAAGTLLRTLVPRVLAERPELPGRYDIEILAAAPELRAVMPMARETLTSAATVAERTRFYPADRSAQLAHGLTEFLRDYLGGPAGGHCLVVENVDQADPTDAELLAILLRRLDPRLLTLVLCGSSDELADPLAEAMARYPTRHDVPAGGPAGGSAVGPVEQLAADYVASECLAEDPALSQAYHGLDPATRARLHDLRADQLAAREETSLRLGAIPFHREHGSDPTEVGVEALRFAINYTSLMGYYHATADFAVRARPLVDWDRPKLCHLVTARLALALILIGRAGEVEELYNEARLHTTEPEMHMMAAYSTAMLYTRHHEPARIDHLKAKAWINQAIAFGVTYTRPAERAFHTVFMQNGLALIESHLGNSAEALRLVEAGSIRLEAELREDEHLLHRSVLQHNSGQVRAAAGNLEAAITDFDAAIAQDPNYAPYHFDRAGLLHRLGRDEESIADYETAIRLSPPLPEAYYNRGDIRAGLGDLEGALADFDYTLELSPTFIAALINRAGLLAELGQDQAARRDVETGLAIEPANPHLLSIRGQLDAAAGDLAAAATAYDTAIAADPGLQAAWAGRASVAFERGDLAAAIEDLERALEIGDSAALRYNRAAAFLAAGRWDDALADLNRAVELDPADADTLAERARCLRQLATAGS
ncbi:MAG: tetratricopeptide repeat protein [Jatrophihabitans sp.]